MVPRSQAEDSRYAAQISRLNAELAAQRGDRKQLQSQIDEVVSRDTSDAADLDRKISAAAESATGSRKVLRSVFDGKAPALFASRDLVSLELERHARRRNWHFGLDVDSEFQITPWQLTGAQLLHRDAVH
jgi:hypothetical protein